MNAFRAERTQKSLLLISDVEQPADKKTLKDRKKEKEKQASKQERGEATKIALSERFETFQREEGAAHCKERMIS